MRVSEQIRARREQLGVTVRELAKRAKVSEQAVRHWEGGRSFPGKATARRVESALSFTIDWTEGKSTQGRPVGANALIGQEDVELLLVLVRLPPPVKKMFADLASAFVLSHKPRPRTADITEEQKNAVEEGGEQQRAKRTTGRQRNAQS
jgi:transcriptional regulator with XRE-family HTH domain